MLDPMDEINLAVVTELEARGREIEADIRRRISTTVFPRSKPGEPPRKQSGQLYASIESHVDVTPDGPVLHVSSDCPYAYYLENGTANMAARPYFAPAIQDAAANVENTLRQAVERSLPAIAQALTDL